jgi:hypothetical protein
MSSIASLTSEIIRTKQNGPMADAGSMGEITGIDKITAVTKKNILK